MGQKAITIILCLLIVGGLVWYFNKNIIEKTAPSSTKSTGTVDESVPATSSEGLVYLNKGTANEIWETSEDKKLKKIFTDADETFKIVMVSNVSVEGNFVLALVSSDKTAPAKLVQIDLATSKVKTLKDSFPVPENFSVSADGKLFLYTRFSNAEENYGHTLYIEELNGPKITEAFREDSAIKSPAWSPDNAKIIYVKESGTASQIISYDIAKKQPKTISSQDKKIVDWICWTQSDKILISVRDLGVNNSGEIQNIDASSGESAKLTTFSGGIANFIYLDPTKTRLAFLVAQYSTNVDASVAGQIYVFSLNDSQKKSFQRGFQILGWTKKYE